MPQYTLPVRLNQLTLDCIVKTGTPPPHAARILAIVHTAIYDAWAVHKRSFQPYRLGEFMRRPEAQRTKANREQAIIYAAFRVLNAYFQTPLEKKGFATLLFDELQKMGFAPDGSLDPATPTGIGNLAAQAILDYRAGDGSNVWRTLGGDSPYTDYTAYQARLSADAIPTKEQRAWWQPVLVPQADDSAPKAQKFLVPHWGLVTPFALSNGWEFRPENGPEPYYTGRFERQCEETLQISANLTERQKAIAEYWADGPNSVTPPGHWCVLAAIVSQKKEHSLGEDVRLFFALTNALMDSGIACWDCKRSYNYVRPVTAIRNLYRGKTIRAWGGPDYGGVRNMKGEEWHPYQGKHFVTPPFPEYTSGHSTFSAAGAEILQRFTGSDAFDHYVDIEKLNIDPAGLSHTVTLHWKTYSEAAAEAGMSRLYGGIHFMDANLKGQEVGRKIGAKVWAKCKQLWEGTW